MDIRVARLVEAGRPFELGSAAKPVPGPRDVLVRVAACNLVPNVANIAGGLTPFTLPRLPAIFGLDVAGTIEAVGEHVVGVAVGERVYVDPFLTCETCHHCRRGRRDLCAAGCLRGYFTWSPEGETLLNAYPYGGLSEYVVSPHNKLGKLPAAIGFPTASRFGYLGTSFAALRKGKLRPGQTLLINGVTGTLGVGAVLIALALGASRIVGIGRNRQLLEQVHALAPERMTVFSSDDGDHVAQVRALVGGLGVDMLYDCTGAGGDAASTNRLLGAVKDGSRAVLVGGGVMGDLSQSYLDILIHDVHALGSMWFSDDDLDRMIAMVASGLIDLSSWRHRIFPLDRVNDALALVATRPGGFVNVVVAP